MVNIDLIQQKLPENLREIAKNYTISDSFLEKMPEIISLILESKSLDTQQEKQSWFDLLPLMNQEQIDKLKDILTREKEKLQEIEQKYSEKKDAVINKYVNNFNGDSYQNKINQIQEAEALHEEKDDQEAEALLQNL